MEPALLRAGAVAVYDAVLRSGLRRQQLPLTAVLAVAVTQLHRTRRGLRNELGDEIGRVSRHRT